MNFEVAISTTINLKDAFPEETFLVFKNGSCCFYGKTILDSDDCIILKLDRSSTKNSVNDEALYSLAHRLVFESRFKQTAERASFLDDSLRQMLPEYNLNLVVQQLYAPRGLPLVAGNAKGQALYASPEFGESSVFILLN